jgi:formylglycine-generating enzyme
VSMPNIPAVLTQFEKWICAGWYASSAEGGAVKIAKLLAFFPGAGTCSFVGKDYDQARAKTTHRTLKGRLMKTLRFCILLAAAFFACGLAHAVAIRTVPVGNVGNAGDVQSQGSFGSVSYNYRIGRTEVTNAQYGEFLNGVDPTGANALQLYESGMSSDAQGGINFNNLAVNGLKYEIKAGFGNKPVTYVSWYDALRFTNWLHNGQGTGNTEDGAYTLLGGTPTPSNGTTVTRNGGANWWLPSEDEWYKAAYHKNDGATGNYWDYPTSTDIVSYSDEPPGNDAPDQSNTANFYYTDALANGYDDGYAVTGAVNPVSSQTYVTDVGAYVLSSSPYGTFDQGGNVWEFNEAMGTGSTRGLRGGSYNAFSHSMNTANRNNIVLLLGHSRDVGFRVATIPEPGSIVTCLAGVLLLALRRGRLAQTQSLYFKHAE